jgi:protein-S-isoprenylcysteine O-methyltransferase Ste14
LSEIISRFAVLPSYGIVARARTIRAGASDHNSTLALSLSGVVPLRERFTRTLLVQEHQSIERSGPYRWIRHPGYLGSLLCLNGLALASGNLITLLASLAATAAAYGYRIRIEDEMLIVALGPPYAEYRSQVRALFPSFRTPTANDHP